MGTWNNAKVTEASPLTGFTYAYDIKFAASNPDNPHYCEHTHLYNFLFVMKDDDMDEYLFDIEY